VDFSGRFCQAFLLFNYSGFIYFVKFYNYIPNGNAKLIFDQFLLCGLMNFKAQGMFINIIKYLAKTAVF